MSALIFMTAVYGGMMSPTGPTCAVARSTVFYDRFADLPTVIRDDVLTDGPIAEAGAPFNATDNILDPQLPRRRFVLAGRSGGNWFVWYFHGGLGPHEHVLGYRLLYSHVDEAPTPYRAADFTGEPCVAINAFLNGVTTNLREQQTARP